MSDKNKFNVSVIIPTKNRYNDLITCMDSLNSQTYQVQELIIIDSGDQKLNTKLNIDKCDKYYKLNIRYFNYVSSLTAARNMGILQSKGDIILFLDDDVVLDKNYIDNIIQIFENYGNVGCVCGDIVSDAVRSRGLSRYIKYPLVRNVRNFIFDIFFLTSWGNGRFHPSGFPTHPIGKTDIMYIECVQGANMAFKREVLDKFKFDENLQGYCYMEDCDMSYRVSKEYRIIYTPCAKLVHNVSPASRYSDYAKMKMAIQNHYYIFNKNFPQKLYNRFAFWTSIFGLFVICFLGMRKEGLKGLYEGLIIIKNK